MKSKFLWGSLFLTPLSLLAHTPLDLDQIAQTRCFAIESESPQRQLEIGPHTVTACYMSLDANRQLMYIKDDDGANKLTSVLTTQNEKGIELAHFSQAFGEITRAKQRPYAHNPMPAPARLEEALTLEDAQEISPLSVYSDRLKEQLEEIVQSFYDKNMPEVDVEDFGILSEDALSASTSAQLPPARQPKDGYWWPHTGVPLANGPDSPLAKYDKYVESVTGRNPRSYEWERANHFTDTFWAGHCNGWVSSSILYGYDGVTLRDHRNNTLITASDLQGLRTATSYCVSTKVVGRRYRGDRSDVWDVYPDKFHKNLEYQIRFMRKPIAMDYLSMMPVDNHIISGYHMTYQNSGTRRVLVTAKLRVHAYNYTQVHVDRVAKPYELVYKYHLYKDSRGRITGGKWLDPGNHPDFLWVPLAQAKCSGENPRMHHKFVDQMIKDLKPATRRR